MCLGVPMRVMRIDGESGLCELEGVRRETSLVLLEEVAEGDFVLVHAGFAIARLNPEEAQETLALFRQFLPAGVLPE